MNITLPAKMMAKKMYTKRLAATPIKAEALQTIIAGSSLNNESLESVFKFDVKKCR